MADNFKGVATDGKPRPSETAGNGAEPGVRLVKWESEPSKVAAGNGADKAQPLEPLFKQADSTKPTDKPGCLTVNYDSAKGLDKPVGPDVVHLTINSPKGINLATNLIFGPGIEPHYKTVIGEPDATKGIVLRGEFDISPNLQDITLHYTDSKGIVRDQTYPASQLRLAGTADAINPHANDFRKPDQQRPVVAQYPDTTSIYEFGYRLSDISGKALGFMEKTLVDEKAKDKTGNPYLDINLAEARIGLAMQHYSNAFGPYDDTVRAREKQYALQEIAEAKKNYANAIDLAKKQMQALPNPGSLTPHNYLDPLGRRFAPEPPYGDDYYPLVYGSALDTANWRNMQLGLLQGMMSVNGTLPPRKSTPRIDKP